MAALKKRERNMAVAGAVILVVLFSGFYFGRGPMETYKKSQTALKEAKQRLITVREWHDTIVAERSDKEAVLAAIRQRAPGFDLWTFMDGLLRKDKINERAELRSKPPVASSNLAEVELTLNGVSMQELANLLHEVYASKNLICVRKMDRLKVARDGKGLECQLSLVTPKA